MAGKTYVIGCVGCGPKHEKQLNLESEHDVAELGLLCADLLVGSHTPIVFEGTLAEMEIISTRILGRPDGSVVDAETSNWKDLN